MPWQLTTPIGTGDLDTVAYSEVTITEFRFSNQRQFIMVQLEYGNTVSGTWVPGITPLGKQASHVVDGAAFLSLVANATPDVGETTYQAVKRALYEQLLADGIIDAGTIV